jgi:predicted enzyme related to lactoylglutathione lyase
MNTAKSIDLVWIVVKDFKTAVKFYTDVVGLKLMEMNEEWGWAELQGYDEEGMRLGIAQQSLEGQDPVQPGQNAVLTIKVDNIDKATKNLLKQNAKLVGSIVEVPGHVKLQTVKDSEGNYFQLVEKISEKSCSTDDRMSSCCCH